MIGLLSTTTIPGIIERVDAITLIFGARCVYENFSPGLYFEPSFLKGILARTISSFKSMLSISPDDLPLGTIIVNCLGFAAVGGEGSCMLGKGGACPPGSM